MNPTIDSARRRFFFKAGAALSAPLAIVSVNAEAAAPDDAALLKARLAMLEDANAIRDLERALLKHVSSGAHDEIARLFVDAANAKLDGVCAMTDDPQGGDGFVEIAADGQTATSRLPCAVEIATPIEPVCPLVEMARAQGGGVAKRSERGVLQSTYMKQEGVWKIERSKFRTA